MTLYKHQKELVDLFPKKWLLAHEMGTGKTATAIALADKTNQDTLVVCPKSLKENWANEIKKFSNNPKRFTIIHKEEFRRDWNELPIYNCVIVDEAHHFSGIKSQMHKSLFNYIKKNDTEYIYLLTGTPYLSTPLNILALGKILGKDWKYHEFIYHFFNKIKMGNRYVPLVKPNIENQIADLVSKLGNTIKLQDLTDIPDQIYKYEYFDLNKYQKKLFKFIDEEFELPIVRLTKVHQVEQGTLKGDEYNNEKVFNIAKNDRILELAQEHKKLVIVARYNLQLDALYNLLKDKYNVSVINGKTKNKQEIIDEANTSDNYILLINASISEGYNLPTFPIMIFASMDYSLKNTLQIMARIQRINNIKKNIYIFLLTEGNSIDQGVCAAFKRKEDFDIAIFNR